MTDYSLPPDYAVMPSRVLFGDISAGPLRTALRLYGLAWDQHSGKNKGHCVALDVRSSDLCRICCVKSSQVKRHLDDLSKLGVLRYAGPVDGLCSDGSEGYRITLPARCDWAGLPVPAVDGAVPSVDNDKDDVTSVDKKVILDDKKVKKTNKKVKISDKKVSPSVVVDVVDVGFKVLEQQHQQQRGGGESEGRGNDRRALLAALGIAEPTRSTLAAIAHVTPAYLERWADWDATQNTFGPGWIVTQIRAGEEPPEAERNDRRRYVSGELGEYIQS